MLAIYIVTLLVLVGSDILPSKVLAGSSGSSDSNRSSGSSGSSDSSHTSSKSSEPKDNDEHHCRKAEPLKETIEKKIQSLSKTNQPLPACKCGSSGTISKIEFFNSNYEETTTLMTCSGCTGSQVPITSSTECENVPDIFRPDLKDFCQIVHLRCKSVSVYRCYCPSVNTTEARPTPLSTTTSFTSAGPVITSTPLQTTTSVPPPPVATQGIPLTTTTSVPPPQVTTQGIPLTTTTSVPLPQVTTQGNPVITISPTPFLEEDYTGYG